MGGGVGGVSGILFVDLPFKLSKNCSQWYSIGTDRKRTCNFSDCADDHDPVIRWSKQVAKARASKFLRLLARLHLSGCSPSPCRTDQIFLQQLGTGQDDAIISKRYPKPMERSRKEVLVRKPSLWCWHPKGEGYGTTFSVVGQPAKSLGDRSPHFLLLEKEHFHERVFNCWTIVLSAVSPVTFFFLLLTYF